MELLFFLVALISLVFCLWPFLRSNELETGTHTTDTPLGRLLQRKETLLQNIADLAFEYDMGKLSEEDFSAMRARLKAETMEVIEQIEILQESEALLQGKSSSSRRSPDRPSTGGGSTAARFCAACGEPLPPGARFCAACGAKVQDGATKGEIQ